MLTAIQGDNIISPVPSPTKKVKRKKGQGSRKVTQPKSLTTETYAPKPGQKGQQTTLTVDTLRVITQSLAPKQRPTEGTGTSHLVSSGKPVPKGSADINKSVESEPTKPSHPAKGSGKSQPEFQGVRGPIPSVGQHYSTEKGAPKQSHPVKGSDKSQSGSQGEKGSRSSVGQHYSTEKGTHQHSHPAKGSGKSQPKHQGVLVPKSSTGLNKPVGKGASPLKCLMRTFANPSFCLRAQKLIPKTRRETNNPLIGKQHSLLKVPITWELTLLTRQIKPNLLD
jgi:hypothetical protein